MVNLALSTGDVIAGSTRTVLNRGLSGEILFFGADTEVNAGDIHGTWPRRVYGSWLTIEDMANKEKHDVNCPQTNSLFK